MFGRRMEPGCWRDLGGRGAYPARVSGLRLTGASGAQGLRVVCVRAAPATCLPSPRPGRRASPLNAREPEPEPRWLCGCRSARATAVPARHKRPSNHSGAGAHEKGGPRPPAARRLRERPRGWDRAPRGRAGTRVGAPSWERTPGSALVPPARPGAPRLRTCSEPRDVQRCTPTSTSTSSSQPALSPKPRDGHPGTPLKGGSSVFLAHVRIARGPLPPGGVAAPIPAPGTLPRRQVTERGPNSVPLASAVATEISTFFPS